MNTTAIILAGGRSSRMGTDKALLELGGCTVLERLIRELEPVASRIVIAAGDKAVYDRFGKEVVTDLFPGAGPLAGLHAGLESSATCWSLAVACDTPFANSGLFRALQERAEAAEEAEARAGGPAGELAVAGAQEGFAAAEAILARTEGRAHPLLAAYRRSVLPGLEERLRAGRLKMTAWTETLRTEYIEGETLALASGLPLEWCAFNMNKPEDYEQARVLLESGLLKD
ncbi:molybdenum cofactor guanylyltransferase [Paenibacillus timonensis]|jgi:molybdenum cofactor guanylyltransferase|uniref:Probable molybdenum cofactor guanylyltransferase n=1 Tax=Paenibacillus timonensis TaxID=225915 RepID=A0ABW3SCT0_9BACL|nr:MULTISPECIES: molybdenum cofactor guanylyltransferase [Paenibacillus]MCH1640833.1 molybdenum cofactor guanylyltransferase [Paenibacillus timonensis]MDU2243655.1 molybdenum cofactor guanylyltransferase [Paenibacillus sp.]